MIYFAKLFNVRSKIIVQKDVQNVKSENMTSSGEIGLNIKKCNSDQVDGEVSVLCWLATPVQCSMETSRNSVIRSKSVIRLSSQIMSLFR